MKYTSICIKCGQSKGFFRRQCISCGFQPASQLDLAKSLMLSTNFEIQSNEFGNEYLGKTWNELQKIGQHIGCGEPYEFDPDLLEKARQQIESIEQLTPRMVLKSVVLWLSPVMLMIVVVLYLAFRS